MARKKNLKNIQSLEDLTRAQLIQIIRVYNDNHIIKNYHSLNKKKLIEIINNFIHITKDNKVEAIKKPKKVIEYDEFKKRAEDAKAKELLTGKEELKIVRALGRQRGIIHKLKDQLADLDEEIDSDYSLRNDKVFMKDYNDLKNNIEIEKNKLNNVIKIYKKHREKLEELEKKVETKEDKDKNEDDLKRKQIEQLKNMIKGLDNEYWKKSTPKEKSLFVKALKELEKQNEHKEVYKTIQSNLFKKYYEKNKNNKTVLGRGLLNII